MNIIEIAAKIIKQFECCKLTAYLCPAGIWTIGYGNTYYENGQNVKQGDVISQDRAERLLESIVIKFNNDTNLIITSTINTNQKAALISFAYNLGVKSLKNSTLLKKVNENPNDPTIAQEFDKWVKAGGVTLKGLVARRKAESTLYFTK